MPSSVGGESVQSHSSGSLLARGLDATAVDAINCQLGECLGITIEDESQLMQIAKYIQVPSCRIVFITEDAGSGAISTSTRMPMKGSHTILIKSGLKRLTEESFFTESISIHLPGTVGMVAVHAVIERVLLPLVLQHTKQPAVAKKMAELEAMLASAVSDALVPELEMDLEEEPFGEACSADRLQYFFEKWTANIRALKGAILKNTGAAFTSLESELNLWTAYADRLHELGRMLKSPQLERLVSKMREAKRLTPIVQFMNEANVSVLEEHVHRCQALVQEIILPEFRACASFKQLYSVMAACTEGLITGIKVSSYPLQRFVKLVDALGAELVSICVDIEQGSLEEFIQAWTMACEFMLQTTSQLIESRQEPFFVPRLVHSFGRLQSRRSIHDAFKAKAAILSRCAAKLGTSADAGAPAFSVLWNATDDAFHTLQEKHLQAIESLEGRLRIALAERLGQPLAKAEQLDLILAFDGLDEPLLETCKAELVATINAQIESLPGEPADPGDYAGRYRFRVAQLKECTTLKNTLEILCATNPKLNSILNALQSTASPKAVVAEWIAEVARTDPVPKKGMPHSHFLLMDHMQAFASEMNANSFLLSMRMELQAIRPLYESLMKTQQLLHELEASVELPICSDLVSEFSELRQRALPEVDWGRCSDDGAIKQLHRDVQAFHRAVSQRTALLSQMESILQMDDPGRMSQAFQLLQVPDVYRARAADQLRAVLVSRAIAQVQVEASVKCHNGIYYTEPSLTCIKAQVDCKIGERLRETARQFRDIELAPSADYISPVVAALIDMNSGRHASLPGPVRLANLPKVSYAPTGAWDDVYQAWCAHADCLEQLEEHFREQRPVDRVHDLLEQGDADKGFYLAALLGLSIDEHQLRQHRMSVHSQVQARTRSALLATELLKGQVGAIDALYDFYVHIGGAKDLMPCIEAVCRLLSSKPKPRHWNRLKRQGVRTVGNVVDNVELVHAVLDEIVAEESIVAILQRVQDTLETLEFPLRSGRIETLAPVAASLSEQAKSLSMVRTSPLAASFAGHIAALEGLQQSIWNALSDLWEVQKQLVDLARLFHTTQVRLALPKEQEAFADAERRLAGLLSALNGNCKDLATADLCCLQAVRASFDACFASLKRYLDSKRRRFSRFCYLNDADVIAILGLQPEEINPWIPSLFDGLQTVHIVGQVATHIVSTQGEAIQLNVPLCPVDEFLVAIHEQIPRSLRSILPTVYEQVAAGHIDDSFPHQLVLMCVMDLLGRERDMLPACRAVRHGPLRALLVSECFAPRSIAVQVQRDSIRGSIGSMGFVYGFAYVPLLYTFIRSPINDAFFHSASIALRHRLGSNPFGPAGTGKTESVKYLGKLLGRPVIVFNCDGTWDAGAFERIFAGVRAECAWACFDEFNRLGEGVMSAVSARIHELLNTKEEEPARVFITLNPKYASRQLVPANLKHLFVPFHMQQANLPSVIRAWFSANAIDGADDVVERFEHVSRERPDVDCGLRAFKLFTLYYRGSVREALDALFLPRYTDASEESLAAVPRSQIGVIYMSHAVPSMCASCIRINPLTLTKEELFGRLDDGCWVDGIFTHHFRAGRSIVFHGGFHADWVEALNSLLDDNRQLSLASGEIVRAGDEQRVVFVTPTLANVTLATVSRCMVVGREVVVSEQDLAIPEQSLAIPEQGLEACAAEERRFFVTAQTTIGDVQTCLQGVASIASTPTGPKLVGPARVLFENVHRGSEAVRAFVADLYHYGGCWLSPFREGRRYYEWVSRSDVSVAAASYRAKPASSVFDGELADIDGIEHDAHFAAACRRLCGAILCGRAALLGPAGSGKRTALKKALKTIGFLADAIHWQPGYSRSDLLSDIGRFRSSGAVLVLTRLQLQEIEPILGALNDEFFYGATRIVLLGDSSEGFEDYFDACAKVALDSRPRSFEGHSFASAGAYYGFVSQLKTRHHALATERDARVRHLGDGLARIHETVAFSDQLAADIGKGQVKLAEADAQAKEQLDAIVARQTEAEQLKSQIGLMQTELSAQLDDLQGRRRQIHSLLEAVEPELIDAKQAVTGISKAHIQELRSMANPPEAVRAVLEAVCRALGKPTTDWRSIQAVIRGDGFIAEVLATESVKEERPVDIALEAAYRASKACGPLLAWLLSMGKYSQLMQQSQPLRQECTDLNDVCSEKQRRLAALQEQLSSIEEQLDRLKQQYTQVALRRSQIHEQLGNEQTRLRKATHLVQALHHEIEQWTVLEASEKGRDCWGEALKQAAFLCDLSAECTIEGTVDIDPVFRDKAIKVLYRRRSCVYDPDGVLSAVLKPIRIRQGASSWVRELHQAASIMNVHIWIDDYRPCSLFDELDAKLVFHCQSAESVSFEMGLSALRQQCTLAAFRHGRPEEYSLWMLERAGKLEAQESLVECQQALLRLLSQSDKLLDCVDAIDGLKAKMLSLQQRLSVSESTAVPNVDLDLFMECAECLLSLPHEVYALTAKQLLATYTASLESSLEEALWRRFGPSLFPADRDVLSAILRVSEPFETLSYIPGERVLVLTEVPLELSHEPRICIGENDPVAVDGCLLENIHLVRDLSALLDAFWIGTCDLHRPPPAAFLQKCRTVIVQDARTYEQLVEAFGSSQLARIHAKVVLWERGLSEPLLYRFTADCLRLCSGGDRDSIRSVYTSRLEQHQVPEVAALLDSVLGEE